MVISQVALYVVYEQLSLSVISLISRAIRFFVGVYLLHLIVKVLVIVGHNPLCRLLVAVAVYFWEEYY